MTTFSDVVTTQGVALVDPITGPQKKFMMALTTSNYGFSRDVRLKIISHILGKEIDSITTLSKREAILVISMLDFCWKIAEIHADDDDGYWVEQDTEFKASRWHPNAVPADPVDVDAIMGFAEKYLKLAGSQQMDLMATYWNYNLTSLYAITPEQCQEMWELYRFSYKIFSNYPALVDAG